MKDYSNYSKKELIERLTVIEEHMSNYPPPEAPLKISDTGVWLLEKYKDMSWMEIGKSLRV